ncbi:MAG: nicotinate-nucleotide adenylyltransferase [Longimicrobiales bacterium]
MRLGIFGGTFDPPHLGHLIVAQDAALALALDRVLFVPAGTPPHKRDRQLSPAAARLAMVEAATAGNDRFDVEPWELEQTGPSYTLTTLRHLRQQHPEAELWLLIGADQWAEFATWRGPEEILSLACVGVIGRAGTQSSTTESTEDTEKFGGSFPSLVDSLCAQCPPWLKKEAADGRVKAVSATRIDISSSEVRRRVGVGESVRYLVPDSVIEIIFREQLYR